mgnify:CR=1 FL=1
MDFAKESLSFELQVERLVNRGLIVSDKSKASDYLSHINYYRLGTYCWSFIDDHKTHSFKANTTFEQVLNLYVFDRELRLLLLDAIERIEISLRTQWAFHLSKKYGPHAHLETDVFNKKFAHKDFVDNLLKEIDRTSDKNIKRQAHKYEETTPAIWIICEVMSFGWLSRCYDGIGRRALRMDIADTYKLKEVVLSSFLHHITTVRNICAHHSRLWNREFTFEMKLPTNGASKLLDSFNSKSKKRLYNTLVMCAYLMDVVNPNHHWKSRLKDLVSRHNIDVSDMGFPEIWATLPIWKE